MSTKIAKYKSNTVMGSNANLTPTHRTGRNTCDRVSAFDVMCYRKTKIGV